MSQAVVGRNRSVKLTITTRAARVEIKLHQQQMPVRTNRGELRELSHPSAAQIS